MNLPTLRSRMTACALSALLFGAQPVLAERPSLSWQKDATATAASDWLGAWAVCDGKRIAASMHEDDLADLLGSVQWIADAKIADTADEQSYPVQAGTLKALRQLRPELPVSAHPAATVVGEWCRQSAPRLEARLRDLQFQASATLDGGRVLRFEGAHQSPVEVWADAGSAPQRFHMPFWNEAESEQYNDQAESPYGPPWTVGFAIDLELLERGDEDAGFRVGKRLYQLVSKRTGDQSITHPDFPELPTTKAGMLRWSAQLLGRSLQAQLPGRERLLADVEFELAEHLRGIDPTDPEITQLLKTAAGHRANVRDQM